MVGLANWTSQSGMQAGDTPWLMQGANSAVDKGIGGLKDGITGLYGQLQQNNSDSALSGLLSGAHSYADIQNKIATDPTAFTNLTPQGRKDLMALQSGFDQHDLTGARIGEANATSRYHNVLSDEEPQKLALEGQRVKYAGLTSIAAANASNAEAALRRQQMGQGNTLFNQGQQEYQNKQAVANANAALLDPDAKNAWLAANPNMTEADYEYAVLHNASNPQTRVAIQNAFPQYLRSANFNQATSSLPAQTGKDAYSPLLSDHEVDHQPVADMGKYIHAIRNNAKDTLNTWDKLADLSAPNATEQSAINSGVPADNINWAKGQGYTGQNALKAAYLKDYFDKNYGSSYDSNTGIDWVKHNMTPEAALYRDKIHQGNAVLEDMERQLGAYTDTLNNAINFANKYHTKGLITPEQDHYLSDVVNKRKAIIDNIKAQQAELQKNIGLFNPNAPISSADAAISAGVPAAQLGIAKDIGWGTTGVGGGY